MKVKYIAIAIASISFLALGCNKQTQLNQNTSSTSTTVGGNDNVYIDSTHKVSLDYNGLNMLSEAPSSYIPAQSNFDENGKDLLSLYLDPTTFTGTNLEAAWFNLAIDDKLDSKTCYAQIKDAGFTSPFNQPRVVQGNTWMFANPNPLGDAAAGHRGLTENYRLFKNNLCYEVRLGASSFVKENLENPNSVQEYNQTKIFGYLGKVFNNLKVE